jgi:hypothetical protein
LLPVIQPNYRKTGNFCGFGLKRRHLIFADFFFCGLKISAPKKKVELQEATTEGMKDSFIMHLKTKNRNVLIV